MELIHCITIYKEDKRASWSLDLGKYAEKTKQKTNDVKNKFAFKLYSSIVQKTPVDTGRARGNWLISPNAPTGEVDENATAPKYNAGNAPKADNDESIYIENNLPYINALEYGGYPDPVKKGTYEKGKGYVVKSKNGFSKQAPHGMVGLTMARYEKLLNEVIKEGE